MGDENTRSCAVGVRSAPDTYAVGTDISRTEETTHHFYWMGALTHMC